MICSKYPDMGDLSHPVLGNVAVTSASAGPQLLNFQETVGAPEGIRTPDPQIRSLVLYPAELPAPNVRAMKEPRPVRERHSKAQN